MQTGNKKSGSPLVCQRATSYNAPLYSRPPMKGYPPLIPLPQDLTVTAMVKLSGTGVGRNWNNRLDRLNYDRKSGKTGLVTKGVVSRKNHMKALWQRSWVQVPYEFFFFLLLFFFFSEELIRFNTLKQRWFLVSKSSC